MMNIRRDVKSASVAIVLHPDWREVIEMNKGQDISIRKFEEIDCFATAMRQCGLRQTAVYYEDEFDDSSLTMMLICEEPVVQMLAERWSLDPAVLIKRVILLNVGRGAKSARRVDMLGAAGAIEGGRYRTWRIEREDDPGGGLFGRKDIADEIGATWASPALWETERYCLMRHEVYSSLPALLAAYLGAYGKTL